MKKFALSIAIASLFMTSCRNAICKRGTVADHAEFIPKDTAARMVQSYLNSIQYSANDTDLRSITINASDLRFYLDSLTVSNSISNIEIKLAHTLAYIKAGGENTPAGYRSDALTFIIVGKNPAGQYVYADNNVIDRGTPCPTNCPNNWSPLFK